MPVLIDNKGVLEAPNQSITNSNLAPVRIGSPLAISLLTFHPGAIKSDWGGKAEIMISSQVRSGPSQNPAPELINMMLRKYNFRTAPPIQDYGADVYGDPMLFYTKSYLGQRIGLTLHGTEMDRIGSKNWGKITSAMQQIGKLALFAPATPYLASAGLAVNVIKALSNLFNRNDKLLVKRKDFYFDEINKTKLQPGRYLFWKDGTNINARLMKNNFKLTTDGDPDGLEPNVVIQQSDRKPLRSVPYFVLQIDGKKRKEYDDFEIGAGSAALLEEYGTKDKGTLILQSIQTLAAQVNDAKQLSELNDMLNVYKSTNGKEKEHIGRIINAHIKLFSVMNHKFISSLLIPYLRQ